MLPGLTVRSNVPRYARLLRGAPGSGVVNHAFLYAGTGKGNRAARRAARFCQPGKREDLIRIPWIERTEQNRVKQEEHFLRRVARFYSGH